MGWVNVSELSAYYAVAAKPGIIVNKDWMGAGSDQLSSLCVFVTNERVLFVISDLLSYFIRLFIVYQLFNLTLYLACLI